MISLQKILLPLALLALLQNNLNAKTCLLTKKDCDIEIDFWGFWKPEQFYGERFTFLNKNVPADKIFYFRHTNDYFLNLVYGKETYGYPVAEFKTSVRNRAVWGSPSSIANTLPAEAPFLDAETKEHFHALPRLFFWMREVWLKVSLAELLHLGFENKHSFTLGAFPFELGRGISLGAAYALGPGPLGFYSDSMIDQFAFGFKFSGDIIEDMLQYDLYGALLQSRSSTLLDTAKPVLRNEIGHREDPARGFGKDNYLIAGRFLWTVFKNECGQQLTVEPYAMYNNDPEQRVEFPADANSKLGTLGAAAEYIGTKFECGIDAAFNLGHQLVRPWDRNYTVVENYNGQSVLVNNQVLIVSDNQFNGLKAPHVPKSDAQKAIDTSAAIGTSAQNGQIIEGAADLPSLGYVPGPLSLQNSNKRFRNAYTNTYHGYMVVGDASYWLYKKDLQVAVTAGIASGGEDPNHTPHNSKFNGFIALQEAYAGKRVKSVFVLGTVGKVKRPGTTPDNPLVAKDFAASDSGFTNLIFVGTGFTWKPSWCDTRFICNPNVLAYWKDVPGKKFNALTGKDLPENASRYLGIEVNTLLSYFPIESLKCFAIGSVFCPGSYFKDIKGRPLSPAERRALERFQKHPNPEQLPNIGDNTAYTINVGMEFAF